VYKIAIEVSLVSVDTAFTYLTHLTPDPYDHFEISNYLRIWNSKSTLCISNHRNASGGKKWNGFSLPKADI